MHGQQDILKKLTISLPYVQCQTHSRKFDVWHPAVLCLDKQHLYIIKTPLLSNKTRNTNSRDIRFHLIIGLI